MTVLRFVVGGLGAAFLGMVLFAIATGDFWAAGAFLTSDPWGIVTLADLYLGFLLAAIVIGLFERGWKAAFWIIPLPFLGNFWAAAWFVLRLPELARRLGR